MTDAPASITMVGVDPACLGGIATLARCLCDRFSRDAADDFAYIVSSNQSSAFGKAAVFARALCSLRRRLNAIDPAAHIVHIHMADNASVMRARVVVNMAKKRGVKTLVHVHCDLAKIYEASSSSMKTAIEDVMRACDAVVALGSYMRDFAASFGHGRDSFFVLPNAVSCPASNPFDARSHKALFLGNVSQDKGVLDLLDALAAVKEDLPADASVDLCGRDFLSIQDCIRERGLADIVNYRGVVSPDDGFFAHYGLHVLPSHKEALPFALLEASAHGIPSVVTDAGSMAEVVASDEDGFVVRVGDVSALGDRIRRMLSDDALRSKMSRAVFEKTKAMYSMDAYMKKLGGLYERVLIVP
ncbi:MAG: glycosyltransferase family 4 protein [Slackia sp.]|nr:glycosyltransferase family 4 protein [Slackia sp.]